MNRKSKLLLTQTGITLACMAAVVLLSFPQISLDDKSAFCGDTETTVIDHELPVSHPANRCANEGQTQGVSWSEWFTGRSSSYQFHFIDLLELLSRSGNSEAENPAKTN
jgi:hypothetical protein